MTSAGEVLPVVFGVDVVDQAAALVWATDEAAHRGVPLRLVHAIAVVVGRRGREGFTGMRLGSVPHGLLHRAVCPVVTVPSSAHEDR